MAASAAAEQGGTTAPAAKPKSKRKPKTIAENIAGIRRMLRSTAMRIVDEGDLDHFVELAGLKAEIDEQIDYVVRALRSEPHCFSWTEIGDQFGISRQAAQKRWGHLDTVNPRKVGGQPGNLR